MFTITQFRNCVCVTKLINHSKLCFLQVTFFKPCIIWLDRKRGERLFYSTWLTSPHSFLSGHGVFLLFQRLLLHLGLEIAPNIKHISTSHNDIILGMKYTHAHTCKLFIVYTLQYNHIHCIWRKSSQNKTPNNPYMCNITRSATMKIENFRDDGTEGNGIGKDDFT